MAGNHGEDVKELYYYLDSTPTHSYMKYLYKYPQAKYPYEQLLLECSNRSREVSEFEIMDTDVFDEDRYWDVFMEVRVGVDWMWGPSGAALTDAAPACRSTPRTRTTQTGSRSASRRTTAGRTRPTCTSSRRFFSATRGRGARTCPRTAR